MGVRRALSWVRQALTALLLYGVTLCIAYLVPRKRWYAASLRSARFITRIFIGVSPNTKNNPAASMLPRLLHRHLDILSGQGGYFPIPTVVEGEEHLARYVAEPGGFVACSAHLPFVKLGFPVLRKAVGDTREIRIVSRDPSGHVSGWNDPGLNIIRADSSVLLHTRSFLRANGCLALTVDKDQGDVISANIFRFAGKLNSSVLMFFPQMLEDGRILLKWMVPPYPHCRSEQEIRANLDVVSENISRILGGDGMRETHELRSEAEADLPRDKHRIQLYSDTQLEGRIHRIESMLAKHNASKQDAGLLRRQLELLYAESQARGRSVNPI